MAPIQQQFKIHNDPIIPFQRAMNFQFLFEI